MSKLSLSSRLSDRYDRAVMMEIFRAIEEQVNGLSEGRMVNRYSAGTAIPTTGNWAKGDILWNSSPSASGVIGWVCITAGTPGTWKPFGFVTAGSSTDNAVVRWNGTSGESIQNSGVICDDSNNITGVNNLTVDGTTILGDSALDLVQIRCPISIAASGAGQIAFPATQVPSSDANTLDDYEEGSWTPVWSASGTAGTQTYTTQIGRYVKVGLIVIASARVLLSAKDAATSGNLQITGLPFTSDTTTNFLQAVTITRWNSLDLDAAGGYTVVSATVAANTTVIALTESGDNVASATLTEADFGNTSQVVLCAVYRASA